MASGRDSPRFGVWCNPVERQIVSYDRGKLETTTCDTDAELAAELRGAKAANAHHGWGPTHIDVRGSEELAQRFLDLGVGELLDAMEPSPVAESVAAAVVARPLGGGAGPAVPDVAAAELDSATLESDVGPGGAP
ncbi:hypothetical protein [Nocardia suismassiliense]|uniref:hypothetical protein n=1 Tax=Nocardia suismassiliense TaxID=2077092 RepID=UPI00131F361F|nr:hypothetical protein [Nocardia suismassiliense]